MTESHAAAPGGTPLHCHHCGRPVEETTHARGSYRVGGYLLHTGETDTVVVRRPDSDAVALVYQRMLRPVVLATCAACYADAARRRLHQTWRYPAD